MPKERNKADGYREKAYEGDTKAMNRSTSGRLLPAGRKNLGVCYERGTGVKVSLELAFEWYRRLRNWAMSMAASTSASATITEKAWNRMR